MLKKWLSILLVTLFTVTALTGCWTDVFEDIGDAIQFQSATSTTKKAAKKSKTTTTTTAEAGTASSTTAKQKTTYIPTNSDTTTTNKAIVMGTTTAGGTATTTTTTTRATTAVTTTAAPLNAYTSQWTGATGSRFAGGDGTANNPYRIETGEQLAYLAKQVNEQGRSFNGDYFVLSNNINLKSHPWTPIGISDTVTFQGIFDGCGYTISNLSITTPHKYETSSSTTGTAGLFGSCENATIRNLTLDGVKVEFYYRTDYLYVGALVGRFYCTSSANITNVSTTDVYVSLNYSQASYYYGGNSFLGGIVGIIQTKNGGWCDLRTVEVTNCSMNIKNNGGWSGFGGIGGTISNNGTVAVQDFACYAKMVHPSQLGDNVCGAFAYVNNASGSIRLEKGFSAITTSNRVQANGQLQSGDTYSIRAAAIVGYGPCFKDSKGGYQLSNVYGYVAPSYGREDNYLGLHRIHDGFSMTERNCVGCISLPAGHGLDATVWDLRSLSQPLLK